MVVFFYWDLCYNEIGDFMEKRLNKYLSEVGFCSRREADRLIKSNRVTVNDATPELGAKLQEGDIIKVDGKVVEKKNKFVYLSFNKPIGVTSTTDQSDPSNIVDYIKYPIRIFHIGRLDKDSEGLIIMTNDGDIVNKILRSGNEHEKEYEVTVDKAITPTFITKMSEGVPILDTVTKECKVKKIDDYTFNIIITQGLNRQIRRMCSYFGYKVVNLKRTRIMNIKLDTKPGKWRYIRHDELRELEHRLEYSIKTEEASK